MVNELLEDFLTDYRVNGKDHEWVGRKVSRQVRPFDEPQVIPVAGELDEPMENQASLSKLKDPDSTSRKHAAYVPFWTRAYLTAI